jgi:iron(III) transport system substrate-binding protein
MKEFQATRRAALKGVAQALAAPALMYGLGTSALAQTAVSKDAWAKVVDAAKKEGAVTIYSSQGPALLNDMAERFKKEYGFPVTVVRAIDAEMNPRVEAEFSTGKGIGDVYVTSDELLCQQRHAKGWYVPLQGPDFDNPVYNRKVRSPVSTYFESNAFVVAFGWNKELLPQGVADYRAMLNPALAGKIGMPNPSNGALVDFYMFLEETNGADFLQRLAALKPRIYPGALPIGQAVVSGEITVAGYCQPLIDEVAKGAPVDWRIAQKAWGARFWGQVPRIAPHPNAAQVLANFMITQAGQEALARNTASSLPNIGLATTDRVHRPDPSKLTPDVIRAYQERWRKMFTG